MGLIEQFPVNARTVEIDPANGQPVAKGMDGKTQYRLWGLVSRELYHANVEVLKEGIYGLGVTLDDIKRDFVRYRNSEALHGHELELGVATISSDELERGFKYLHKDLGIWERMSEQSTTRRVVESLLSGEFEAQLLQ